jgi:hypothetical protein
MQPITILKHHQIQQGLAKGEMSSRRNVRVPLKLENSNRVELWKGILQDLKNMGFTIEYTNVLNDLRINQSVVAITVFRTNNRNDGGTIRVNNRFPLTSKIEAIYHEYAHIKDLTLPIHTTDKDAFNNKATFDKDYLRLIEFQADMIAYMLMMPPEQLREDLIRNSYNIDTILEKYKAFEKSSVLQWIVLTNPLPCHFAWIILQKDNKNTIARRITHDSCYYDLQIDPKQFDIEAVIAKDGSAAAEALKTKKNVHKSSKIDNVDYYCFAYYEEPPPLGVLQEGIPGTILIDCDRLLIIGWAKGFYDMIQFIKSSQND